MKKIFKVFIFLVIFLILFNLVCKILWLPKNSIINFYDEPKNTLDAIYIGSSNVYPLFNAPFAFHEYGYTVGLVSHNAMPFLAMKNLIKESLKYQKPNLYIIDIGRINLNFDESVEGDIRSTTDSMKFSLTRIDAINQILKYIDIPKIKYLDYYFSFSTYHDIWKDEEAIKSNIFGKKDLYKGYLLTDFTVTKEAQDAYEYLNETSTLPIENEIAILELLDYIKSENLNVLFVVPRKVFKTDEEMTRLNESVRIIKERGFDIINFNTLQDFDVDFQNDFYNYEHLNVYGSIKYTSYFARYLNEHYDFKDHRNDEKYESWEKEYQRMKKDFYKLTGESFDKILEEDRALGY